MWHGWLLAELSSHLALRKWLVLSRPGGSLAVWHGWLLAELSSRLALRKWLVLSECLGRRVRWQQLRGAMGLGVQLHGWR